MAQEAVIFRTIGYGIRNISLRNKKGETIFALFQDTYLSDSTGELVKALVSKHEEYEAKGVPVQNRGFVTQELYDAFVVPDKTYIQYNEKMVHIKDVVAGLEVAEKNGWVPPDKNYIYTQARSAHKTSS